MDRVSRFGVSFDKDLLTEFDGVIAEKGYTSRSEALMDLARGMVLDHRTEGEKDSLVTGSLTMVYDHHSGDLTQRMLDLQHDRSEMIASTTHIHVDHHTCLEVLILKGPLNEVRALADSLTSLKGVKQGRLVFTRIEGHHH